MEKSQSYLRFLFPFFFLLPQNKRKWKKIFVNYSFPYSIVSCYCEKSKWRYLLKVKFCLGKWQQKKLLIRLYHWYPFFFHFSPLLATVFSLKFCTWNEFARWWESFFLHFSRHYFQNYTVLLQTIYSSLEKGRVRGES